MHLAWNPFMMVVFIEVGSFLGGPEHWNLLILFRRGSLNFGLFPLPINGSKWRFRLESPNIHIVGGGCWWGGGIAQPYSFFVWHCFSKVQNCWGEKCLFLLKNWGFWFVWPFFPRLSWLVNLPPPYFPLQKYNYGLIKGNQCLISPDHKALFLGEVGGGRLTSHETVWHVWLKAARAICAHLEGRDG